MFRVLTSLLWVVLVMALGFDATAQPCDMRTEAQPEAVQMSDMPCHDGMMMADAGSPEMPEHPGDACCCPALLTNAVTLDAADLKQPLPGLAVWTMPLPDNANSLSFEYEPPPPRA